MVFVNTNMGRGISYFIMQDTCSELNGKTRLQRAHGEGRAAQYQEIDKKMEMDLYRLYPPERNYRRHGTSPGVEYSRENKPVKPDSVGDKKQQNYEV